MNNVAEIIKGKNWIDLVFEIEENSTKHFPIEKAGYVRYILSDKVAKDFPERNFKTSTTESNGKFLTVKRLGDTKNEQKETDKVA